MFVVLYVEERVSTCDKHDIRHMRVLRQWPYLVMSGDEEEAGAPDCASEMDE